MSASEGICHIWVDEAQKGAQLVGHPCMKTETQEVATVRPAGLKHVCLETDMI